MQGAKGKEGEGRRGQCYMEFGHHFHVFVAM